MKITFVMGIPCSGKSYYIQENFKDRKILDLFEYQLKYKFLTYEAVVKSYEDLKEDIIKAIQNNEDIVVEHTFLRAIRRKPYIDAIKEITNSPIDIVVLNPDIETIIKRREMRKIEKDIEIIKEELAVLEIPTTDEGFEKVTIITD